MFGVRTSADLKLEALSGGMKLEASAGFPFIQSYRGTWSTFVPKIVNEIFPSLFQLISFNFNSIPLYHLKVRSLVSSRVVVSSV